MPVYGDYPAVRMGAGLPDKPIFVYFHANINYSISVKGGCMADFEKNNTNQIIVLIYKKCPHLLLKYLTICPNIIGQKCWGAKFIAKYSRFFSSKSPFSLLNTGKSENAKWNACFEQKILQRIAAATKIKD